MIVHFHNTVIETDNFAIEHLKQLESELRAAADDIESEIELRNQRGDGKRDE